MDNQKLMELAQKYLQGRATIQEQEQLHQWYDAWDEEEEIVITKQSETEETIRQRVLNSVLQKTEQQQPIVVLPSHKRTWLRIAAAAAILIALSIGIYFIRFNAGSETAAAINNKKPTQVRDVAPPANTNAVLTLADGTKIVLDNAQNGSLAVQGNVNIVKLADGKIAYSKAPQASTRPELQSKEIPITYNTLTVPRGSKVVTITLTDGTEVWLNAESSLKYPTAFIGNERKVQITGEAYFEVAHNEAMPFKVQKDEAEVQVLGTHFNINAYDDESAMKITLLEGAVKIRNSVALAMLAPGQQAQLNKNGQIILNREADVEQAIAWKNGLFDFDNADITDIMRQLSRWYDIDVMYDGKIPEGHYIGSIRRQVNISEVLRMIELAGGIEFTIEGKKIIVKAK